jgi:hypothetical protein
LCIVASQREGRRTSVPITGRGRRGYPPLLVLSDNGDLQGLRVGALTGRTPAEQRILGGLMTEPERLERSTSICEESGECNFGRGPRLRSSCGSGVIGSLVAGAFRAPAVAR